MDFRCQQFTPEKIASEMLDFIGYQNSLYGQRLLENSCGEGSILCIAVERYIKDSIANGYSSDDIAFGLERDIYGAEIVEDTYKKCIDNLNKIADKYELQNIQWNIRRGDILEYPFDGVFDYIIGNPPYISYRNLEKETRAFIKENYSVCKYGKPDYCYAFIENAIQYLASGGRMVYLVPNSIYKNVYAQELRNMLLQYIIEIRDYPNCKLFSDATTSSAIMFLKKGSYIQELRYRNIPKNQYKMIRKKTLTGKWIFDDVNIEQSEGVFKNYFKASMAIATQRNDIFVISEKTREEYGIERGVLRPAVSPKNQKKGNKEFIIFPYKVRNNQVINYSEKEFKKKYPKTYNYLKAYKKELAKRDVDKSAKWFEYGRSQAIQNMNKKKLLISTVVTNEIHVYDVSSRAVPYAGIYIVSSNDLGLEVAKKILESDDFLQYIKGIGTPASGSSLRITANDIKRFRFELERFQDNR